MISSTSEMDSAPESASAATGILVLGRVQPQQEDRTPGVPRRSATASATDV
jgi:hypothetical protein